MKLVSIAALAACVLLVIVLQAERSEAGITFEDRECEVCLKMVERFEAAAKKKKAKTMEQFESVYRRVCKKTSGRERRFCFYIGGSEDSATGLLREISRPHSYGLPADRICDKLRKKDASICALKYEEPIKLEGVNLKKLRVKKLKEILSQWGEPCRGCVDKSQFVKKVESLRPKHDPSWTGEKDL